MVFPWLPHHNGYGVRTDVQSVRLGLSGLLTYPADFVVSKVTPTMEAKLGYKLFMVFATINISGMAVFAL